MHVDGDALFLQAVTRHQHATVVLRHTTSVTVDVMQRQHDAQPDGTVPHVFCHFPGFHSSCLLGRCFTLGPRFQRVLGEGDVQYHALLQLIVWRIHLRVGLDQLFNGETVFP